MWYWKKEYESACRMPEDMGGAICGCDYPPPSAHDIIENSNVHVPWWMDKYLPADSAFDIWLWFVMVEQRLQPFDDSFV